MEKKESFKGVIIEESLENKGVLQDVTILETEVKPVTEWHKTPWLKQWTLQTVEFPEDKAESIAQRISQSLDKLHPNSWYADFKTKEKHIIVFPNKVFMIDRTQEEYEKVISYGRFIGIPEIQLDFSPEVA